MPVRTIKLKLIAPRSSHQLAVEARRALWETLSFVNRAAAHYFEVLVEMRQDAVCVGQDTEGKDLILPAREFQDRLAARLIKRGLTHAAVVEALPLLQRVYQDIVPIKDTGSGEPANVNDRAWHGALVDPNSTAMSGSKDLELVALVARLRSLGALPILDHYGKGRIQPMTRGILTKFERMALALAAERLASWNTKSSQCKTRRDALVTVAAEIGATVVQTCPDVLSAVRRYEESRHAEIARDSGNAPSSLYRISERTLGSGWPSVRRALKTCNSMDVQERLEAVRRVQQRQRHGSSDAHLLAWLAHPDQRWIVEHPAGDVMAQIVRLNKAERAAERARAHATLSKPDARTSPLFPRVAMKGDNNAPGYELTVEPDGVYAVLNLLAPGPDGLLVGKEFKFKTAPQGQIEGLHFIAGDSRGLAVSWDRQDGSGPMVGCLGGGSLMFDRDHLERANPAMDGDIGAVWLCPTIDRNNEVLNPAHKAELARNRNVACWFNAALHNRGKKKGTPPGEDFRILSIDLGQRVSAVASLFTVNPSDSGRLWPLNDACGLTARHEQTMSLALPGDEATAGDLAARRDADAQVRALRGSLKLLMLIRRAGEADATPDRIKRLAEVCELMSAGTEFESVEHLRAALDLERVVKDDREVWMLACREVYRLVEHHVGLKVGEWRREQREADRLGGLSFWRGEYLERVYRLLRAWNARQRIGKPRRSRDDFWQDTTAKRLREHINHFRDDRSRKIADLIVQAARGYVLERGRWVKRWPKANLIVMEDLSAYKMRLNRGRRENFKLAIWSHGAITRHVELQAEEDGIAVATVDASHTSRFDPLTKAPGHRCHAITGDDLARLSSGDDAFWIRRDLTGRFSHLRIDPDQLKVGDVIPSEGGKLLATVSRCRSGVYRVNADVCASKNIGVRYIEGYATLYRLRGRLLLANGQRIVDVNTKMAKSAERVRGALGCERVLLREDETGTTWTMDRVVDKATARALAGAVEADMPDDAEPTDLPVEEELDAGSRMVTMYRDPSGILFGGRWVEDAVFWPAVQRRIFLR